MGSGRLLFRLFRRGGFGNTRFCRLFLPALPDFPQFLTDRGAFFGRFSSTLGGSVLLLGGRRGRTGFLRLCRRRVWGCVFLLLNGCAQQVIQQAVIRRLVADTPKAAKLLDSVRSSKDPWFYTILAFITPGLPNGIIPYAAANAGMRPKQFLAAIFISLPFPTLLTCAAGSFMLEGNWLFTVLTGIVLFSFVGILFFNRTKFIAWAHEVKNRHTQKAGA